MGIIPWEPLFEKYCAPSGQLKRNGLMTFRFSNFGSWDKSCAKSDWNTNSQHHKFSWNGGGHKTGKTHSWFDKDDDDSGSGSDGSGKHKGKGSNGSGKHKGKGSNGSGKHKGKGSNGSGKHKGKGSNGSGKHKGTGSDGSGKHKGKGSDGSGKHKGKGSDGSGKHKGKGSNGSGKGSHGSDKGTGGSKACGGKSYYNGGVEGEKFSKWYDDNLAGHFDGEKDEKWGDWHSGGGSGKGSDGSGKGSGKGSDGSGKGSDGSGKGSGKGSDGSGKGSDGSGKGSDGSGKGSDGSGKGSDGSGKGSDGSGKGSCGTGGGDPDPDPDPVPTKLFFEYGFGDPQEIKVTVVEDPSAGQLFFNIQQSDWTGPPVDIDGIFFDMAEDRDLVETDLNVVGNQVSDVQTSYDAVTHLPSGASVDEGFDVGLQFGAQPNATVTGTNFTLWSDAGPVTLDDIDLSGMRLIIDSQNGGKVLGVTSSTDPDFVEAEDAVPDSEITFDDVIGLMSIPVDEDDVPVADEEDDMYEDT
jgi:hypothetical protein